MRFMTTLLITTLLLTAGTALAREKTPDVRDTAAAATYNSAIFGTLTTASGVYDRIYNQGNISTQCGAEALDSANDGMYFDVYCLQVDDRNPIELVLDADGTEITDTVLTLYCSPFDPSQPDQNVIAFDDDGGVGTLSAFTSAQNITLEPGHEYWLVISTYGAGMTGNFVIQPSSNVFDCGAVANETASFGTVKGLYR